VVQSSAGGFIEIYCVTANTPSITANTPPYYSPTPSVSHIVSAFPRIREVVLPRQCALTMVLCCTGRCLLRCVPQHTLRSAGAVWPCEGFDPFVPPTSVLLMQTVRGHRPAFSFPKERAGRFASRVQPLAIIPII